MFEILSGLVINTIQNCSGYAGLYYPTEDKIEICLYANGKPRSLKQKLQTIRHELGHRNWFKFMTQEQRNAFLDRYGKDDYRYWELNTVKHRLTGTEYYAEMYSYSVLYKYLDPSYFNLDWTNYEILQIK